MKNGILLSAINAKYIHSNLAVRYLKKYCETQIEGIDIAEFSINDNISSILKKLYCSDAGIYGFSCYIWNISMIL
ncbi:MAG TPA: B12-binding domain-containing radical SAM protein, partial [Bacillota bacterium]|nr:B12-binding domain-containing radical SAM protein [Bacillota bacterium]